MKFKQMGYSKRELLADWPGELSLEAFQGKGHINSFKCFCGIRIQNAGEPFDGANDVCS